jgi:hypothetical protein
MTERAAAIRNTNKPILRLAFARTPLSVSSPSFRKFSLPHRQGICPLNPAANLQEARRG